LSIERITGVGHDPHLLERRSGRDHVVGSTRVANGGTPLAIFFGSVFPKASVIFGILGDSRWEARTTHFQTNRGCYVGNA
jgi:hypothetical protein